MALMIRVCGMKGPPNELLHCPGGNKKQGGQARRDFMGGNSVL